MIISVLFLRICNVHIAIIATFNGAVQHAAYYNHLETCTSGTRLLPQWALTCESQDIARLDYHCRSCRVEETNHEGPGKRASSTPNNLWKVLVAIPTALRYRQLLCKPISRNLGCGGLPALTHPGGDTPVDKGQEHSEQLTLSVAPFLRMKADPPF